MQCFLHAAYYTPYTVYCILPAVYHVTSIWICTYNMFNIILVLIENSCLHPLKHLEPLTNRWIRCLMNSYFVKLQIDVHIEHASRLRRDPTLYECSIWCATWSCYVTAWSKAEPCAAAWCADSGRRLGSEGCSYLLSATYYSLSLLHVVSCVIV